MQLTITLPDRAEALARNRERWAEVLADPKWNQFPDRIETNAFGQIIMTPPPGVPHGSRQSQIAFRLKTLLGGHTVTECPVSTADGVKGVDVGWFSSDRYPEVRSQVACEIAPEICVEVRSPSNSDAELQTKRSLCFDAGAVECWECDERGAMSYYHHAAPDVRREQSILCPHFPSTIED